MTHDQIAATHNDRPHRLAETFAEEVVACLLGGHGITYEMNVAAFNAVRAAGVLKDSRVTESDVIGVLTSPLIIGERKALYRFPNQKSRRVIGALRRLWREEPPVDPHDAREWLMTFDGIGPKTASWVIRNQYDAPDIAIIDIHILRAGVGAQVFDAAWTPARDYSTLESAFIQWAKFGGVAAADLDAVMWAEQASAARRHRLVRSPH